MFVSVSLNRNAIFDRSIRRRGIKQDDPYDWELLKQSGEQNQEMHETSVGYYSDNNPIHHNNPNTANRAPDMKTTQTTGSARQPTTNGDNAVISSSRQQTMARDVDSDGGGAQGGGVEKREEKIKRIEEQNNRIGMEVKSESAIEAMVLNTGRDRQRQTVVDSGLQFNNNNNSEVNNRDNTRGQRLDNRAEQRQSIQLTETRDYSLITQMNACAEDLSIRPNLYRSEDLKRNVTQYCVS